MKASAKRPLLAILAAALVARLGLMILRGDYIVYDEGYYLLLARSLRGMHTFALNGLPHVALSPLQPVVVALVSAIGIPELWVSRLLAVLAGALLVLPVAALGERIGGRRAGLGAALLVALAPALMTFVPFFPGRSWNLYFGSEPLFLLLVFGAVAAAARAAAGGTLRWFVLAGALCGGAFLTRAEGIVTAPLVFLALLWRVRAQRGAWRRCVVGAAVGLLVCAPYFGYLRATLARWAFSGRVQVASEGRPVPSTREAARQGGAVLDAFVWEGDLDAFQRIQYGLTPDGTRMASQYWGVARNPPARTSGAAVPAPVPAPAPPTAGADAAEQRASPARHLLRGMGVVVPLWLLALGLAGVALRGRNAESVWLLPPLLTALVPVFAVYVEPRALLPFAPLAAIGVALLWDRIDGWMAVRLGVLRLAVPGLVVVALAVPGGRDAIGAARGDTPLQRVASAHRAVGAYLGQTLPADARIMSLHPAIAIWAHRDWRVLPYDDLGRIVGYAQAQGAAAIVFSKFEFSPLRDPPRAFTVVLLGAGARTGSDRLRVEPVAETPLLFVGRLARPGP
jgi:4-amino-4-deoxy-L-arabinose transferase-like glycosyltransferase